MNSIPYHAELMSDKVPFWSSSNNYLIVSAWCRVDCWVSELIDREMAVVKRDYLRSCWYPEPSDESVKAAFDVLKEAGYLIRLHKADTAAELAQQCAQEIFDRIEPLTVLGTAIDVQFKVPYWDHIGVVRRAASE